MPNIPEPYQGQPIVDASGNMQETFRLWVNEITRLDLIVGTGSPEGAVEAQLGREYMDDAGIAGAIKYIKQVDDIGGDRSLGWILV